MTNEDWTKNFQKLTELSNLATEKQIEFYRSILVAGAGILGILISFIPHRHLAYISVGISSVGILIATGSPALCNSAT